jgi:beta-lactamase superfamily II metal-dependent hydrolase
MEKESACNITMRIVAKTFIRTLIVIVATFIFGLYIWRDEHRPSILEIYVFPMKSGRSMFVRTPDDVRVLIDGGSNSEIVRKITEILPFYSRRIDIVIATNGDGKNVSGLIDVVDRYKVGHVYIPAVTLQSLGIASSTDQIYGTFESDLVNKGIATTKLLAGDTIDLDSRTNIRILFPFKDNQFVYSKASAPELLFEIMIGNNFLTFLGNASNKIQKAIASSTFSSFVSLETSSAVKSIHQSRVLVLSHSALPANMSPQLMGKIRPEYLVYSRVISRTVTSSPSKSSAPVTSSSSSARKKKMVIDPLVSVTNEKRFNLKEGRTVKVVLDEKDIKVIDQL